MIWLRLDMGISWDYTKLADSYLKRPDYAPEAVERIVALSRLQKGAAVCDVGAGVAHLTIPLAQRGFRVTAVEPNEAMRANGIKRTADLVGVRWTEGTGEATGQPDSAYSLVTFGSSFNVTDRARALKETARILKPGGWFACLWNHRDLEDPLQDSIEALIKKNLKDYDYGLRREDQAPVIAASGLFGGVEYFEARVTHRQTVADCLEAWGSHATLQRQAQAAFPKILEDIRRLLADLKRTEIEIPYITRAWAAPVKKSS